MRSQMIWIVSLILIVLIDTAFGYQIRSILRKKWQKTVYVGHTLLFVAAVLIVQFCFIQGKSNEAFLRTGTMLAILFMAYVPKLWYVLLHALGSLFRKQVPFLFHALGFIGKSVALLLFIVLLYSITGGRYNYKITQVEVPIAHLPESFEGFKIVQLSDLHLGSYGKNYKGVARLVEEVNGLHPDLIVFTGDMVNNRASEIVRWMAILEQLHAPYGKYAVTGNHDYGSYVRWSSPAAQEENMHQLYGHMQAMGFQMLMNTRIPLVRQTDTLWLAGVENWGNPPFPRYGKLNEALQGLAADKPVILLSHDPSHWRGEVLGKPVALTLSGHTHAMQFGIQIGKMEWSPSQYMYPEYDGLYCENGQYLHVSRGQGYIGYPGRVGLRPVITQIILTQPSDKRF